MKLLIVVLFLIAIGLHENNRKLRLRVDDLEAQVQDLDQLVRPLEYR